MFFVNFSTTICRSQRMINSQSPFLDGPWCCLSKDSHSDHGSRSYSSFCSGFCSCSWSYFCFCFCSCYETCHCDEGPGMEIASQIWGDVAEWASVNSGSIAILGWQIENLSRGGYRDRCCRGRDLGHATAICCPSRLRGVSLSFANSAFDSMWLKLTIMFDKRLVSGTSMCSYFVCVVVERNQEF